MLRAARPASRAGIGIDCIKWLAILTLGYAAIVHAQDSELNDEFLEYLGNMESSEDNWTDFSTAQIAPARNNATSAHNSSRNSSDAQSSSSASHASADSKHNSEPVNTSELKASK